MLTSKLLESVYRIRIIKVLIPVGISCAHSSLLSCRINWESFQDGCVSIPSKIIMIIVLQSVRLWEERGISWLGYGHSKWRNSSSVIPISNGFSAKSLECLVLILVLLDGICDNPMEVRDLVIAWGLARVSMRRDDILIIIFFNYSTIRCLK